MQIHTTEFTFLEPEDIKIIGSHGVKRSYPKGAVIINEGDESDTFYIIQSGKVKVFVSDEQGKEAILRIQGPGECFGELALIDHEPRSASVVTLEDACLLVVSKGSFERCIAENPSLVSKLVRTLIQRIRALTENFKSLALQDVYHRLARLLMDLAVKQDDQWVIDQRLTHQDIGNMIGASREMVSRIMKDLEKGNYLEKQQHKVIILRRLPSSW